MTTSADGLLYLAGLSDEEFSLNPWSPNCFLIRQDTAAKILKRFNWPYRNRSSIYTDSELPPLIYQAVRARGKNASSAGNAYDTAADRRLLDLISVFAGRGHSINQQWDGYRPIHLAILFGDSQLVEFLIENEVDLYATIFNPGRAHHELNSFQFAELVAQERPEDYEKILETLAAARSE